MVSLSVRWAYICTRMDRKLLNTGKIRCPKANRKDVPVNFPAKYGRTVHQIIQDCSTYHQETVSHGKRNMEEKLPWNVPFSLSDSNQVLNETAKTSYILFNIVNKSQIIAGVFCISHKM